MRVREGVGGKEREEGRSIHRNRASSKQVDMDRRTESDRVLGHDTLEEDARV